MMGHHMVPDSQHLWCEIHQEEDRKEYEKQLAAKDERIKQEHELFLNAHRDNMRYAERVAALTQKIEKARKLLVDTVQSISEEMTRHRLTMNYSQNEYEWNSPHHDLWNPQLVRAKELLAELQ